MITEKKLVYNYETSWGYNDKHKLDDLEEGWLFKSEPTGD